MKADLRHGDALQVLADLGAASIDSVVTDGPYGIGFMGKEWDGVGLASPGEQAGGPRAFQAWTERWALLALRVLKPGGHLLSFGSTRTYHRMAAGVEDAGFEVRDTIHWTYGSGFPKSLNVGKAIDKNAGEAFDRVPAAGVGFMGPNGPGGWNPTKERLLRRTAPSEAAQPWEGWGTALKPAHELVLLARKPLAGTVADNARRHGVGALNIDATRISAPDGNPSTARRAAAAANPSAGWPDRRSPDTYAAERPGEALGRWPPNMLLTHAVACIRRGTQTVSGDGHTPSARASKETTVYGGFSGQDGLPERHFTEEVVEDWACAPGCPVQAIDEQSGVLRSGDVGEDGILRRGSDKTRVAYGRFAAQDAERPPIYADEGGASRFFPTFAWQAEDFDWLPFIYCAKASRSEREAGTEGLPARTGAQAVGPVDASDGLSSPRAGAGRTATEVRNHHPTVKPLELMEWLCRLVTPPGGLVLDPFLGSGTTACAAVRQGFRVLGIEREADYMRIAKARVAYHSQPFLNGEPRPERSLKDFLGDV